VKSFIEQLFHVLLAVVIPLASFDTGLAVPESTGNSLWRRPSEMARALLAVLIAVPLWVVVLVQVLPLSPVVQAGLLVATVAVGIGPIAALKRMAGQNPYARDAFDLNLAVLFLSMFFVPLAFGALAALYRRDLHLGFWPVAKVVLGRALVPLLIGLGVARWRPRFAAKAAPRLARVVNITIAVVLVVGIVGYRGALAKVGVAGWFASGLAALGAVLIGHLFGGPHEETRGVVAVAAVMRFPALALVLAEALPQGKRVIPVVIVYVLAAFVAMTVYLRVTARQERKKGRRPRLVVAGPSPRTV
jgi:bile acid:Na+ symporter, BASS family